MPVKDNTGRIVLVVNMSSGMKVKVQPGATHPVVDWDGKPLK